MNVGITCTVFNGCVNVLLFSIKDLNLSICFHLMVSGIERRWYLLNRFIYSRIYVLNP